MLQTLHVPMPGNIDVRYGFSLNGSVVDLVAVNQRTSGPRILVFRVNAETRTLVRVDDNRILTGRGTGGTLFQSPKNGKLYFVLTSDEDEGRRVRQYELFETAGGRIGGRKVRGWKLGSQEGAVGDDETGKIYIAQEDRGIWEVGGEPTDPTPGRLVIRVGEHGLRADVEGLTIYKRSASTGYLIVSNQSRDAYEVYSRGPAHEHLGHFSVASGHATDGIDVTNMDLGPRFPAGLFACHSEWFVPGAALRCPVLVTSFEQVARAAGLEVDTSWDPRRGAAVASHGPGVNSRGGKP